MPLEVGTVSTKKSWDWNSPSPRSQCPQKSGQFQLFPSECTTRGIFLSQCPQKSGQFQHSTSFVDIAPVYKSQCPQKSGQFQLCSINIKRADTYVAMPLEVGTVSTQEEVEVEKEGEIVSQCPQKSGQFQHSTSFVDIAPVYKSQCPQKSGQFQLCSINIKRADTYVAMPLEVGTVSTQEEVEVEKEGEIVSQCPQKSGQFQHGKVSKNKRGSFTGSQCPQKSGQFQLELV